MIVGEEEGAGVLTVGEMYVLGGGMEGLYVVGGRYV